MDFFALLGKGKRYERMTERYIKIEDFIHQINDKIKNILGKEIIDILTPNFTTTNNVSTIIFKFSIMNAFKKYFEYKM